MVQNVGAIAGEEVVQLYITNSSAKVPVPIRSLAGADRVSLEPGEKRDSTFSLTPRQMSVIDNAGNRVVEPGVFEASIGGKQPGFF